MDVRHMALFTGRPSALRVAVASIAMLGDLGCHAVHSDRAVVCPQACRSNVPVEPSAPRELTKVVLPPYRIEPPDVLQIDAVRVIPKFPYKLRLLDSLVIQVTGTLPDAPIGGTYIIEPSGAINLGNPYGLVHVQGMTVEEANHAIESQLRQTLRDPVVTVAMGDIAGKQQISGQHLVAQDGTVTLGTYGNVLVVGQTIPEAKATIE